MSLFMWKRGRPTERGWYWWRIAPGYPEMIVEYDPEYPGDTREAEWAGPIPKAVETSSAVEYSDEEFLRRAVTWPVNTSDSDLPRWSCVRQMFGVGSTVGHALCRRLGLNPDDLIKPQYQPEGEEGEGEE